MPYDVVIVGGGPAGLSAALAFGRGRKRVLLCDFGPRRNAAAAQVHNFVTRDGIPPAEFRSVARRQLADYPSVEVRDAHVESIDGTRGAFRVGLDRVSPVDARRVLLCTGMVDEMPSLTGFRELWGGAIFQCPYCHGWEVQDRRWGYLALAGDAHLSAFALLLRGWSRDLVVFTGGAFEVAVETRARFQAAGIGLETGPVARLVADGDRLRAVELASGARVPCEVLFAHPPQRQIALVSALGVALDDGGYVRVDPITRETSVPGIYAAGDLTTRQQAAIIAAAAGMQAAAAINAELTAELATSGAI
jgi:thioredoxin reductase